MTKRAWISLLTFSLVVAGAGCSEDTNLASDDGGTGTDTGGGIDTGTAGDAGTGGFDSGVVIGRGDGGGVLCNGVPCACANGIDDDGDGDIDGADAECTGASDNDEGSFGTGIPGDNRDPNCQDCFFDGNSGAGDDGCRYATSCLIDGTPSSGMGSCRTCEPAMRCLDTCRPSTPNGCDCFGCCEVFLDDGSSVNVLLLDGCSTDNIDDTTACPRCMQTDTCMNECGRCELCPGRTIDDLPADCTPDGGVPMYTCDEGQTVCETSAECGPDDYCQLGCCLPLLI